MILTNERIREIEEIFENFTTEEEVDEYERVPADTNAYQYWRQPYRVVPTGRKVMETCEWTWSEWSCSNPGGGQQVPGLGLVETMDTYQGGEGGGEDAELVLKITPADDAPETEPYYLMKQGYYASHCGTEWDGEFFQVAPYVVPKVEYLSVTTKLPEGAVPA